MNENLLLTAKALNENGFETEVFENSKTAAENIIKNVGSKKTLGFGGSMSVDALNLKEKLSAAGNEIIKPGPGISKDEKIKLWLKAQNADFYFASPQAITSKGEMIFLDANGNRGAAVIYGPKKIILIAGYNKLVETLDDGLWRARNIAAIKNNIRLKKDNPCVPAGKCQDCSSENRICNVTTILSKKPWMSNYKVVLVNEELGY
ncbi:MAG: lactate utilization protein [Elusimicrobiales bacterium]|nr:lactate utilization protein [Elusimicrobiales bacterium]